MGIGMLQPMHLLLILAIVLVVFGAGKLGQVGGALGQSIKEFKSNVSDPEEEARLAAEAAAKPVEAPKVVATKVEPVVVATRAAEPAATLRREEI
ncbi:MAG TPA: twin-arginine translocase TatA/TatE family subunit [Thermomicrobiales bacterium]